MKNFKLLTALTGEEEHQGLNIKQECLCFRKILTVCNPSKSSGKEEYKKEERIRWASRTEG